MGRASSLASQFFHHVLHSFIPQSHYSNFHRLPRFRLPLIRRLRYGFGCLGSSVSTNDLHSLSLEHLRLLLRALATFPCNLPFAPALARCSRANPAGAV